MGRQPKRRYFVFPHPYTGRMSDIREVGSWDAPMPQGYSICETAGTKRDVHNGQMLPPVCQSCRISPCQCGTEGGEQR